MHRCLVSVTILCMNPQLGQGQVPPTVFRHEQHINAVAFSPNGKLLAVGDDNVLKLWDINFGQSVWEHKCREVNGNKGPATCVLFSPDGKTFACAWSNGILELWEAATLRQRILLQSERTVFAVAFHPNGKMLTFGGEDRTLALWQVAGPRTLAQGQASIRSLAFSADAKNVACGDNSGMVRLYELATGRERASFPGHTGPVPSLAFSPDGKMLASGSWDRDVRVWPVTRADQVSVLRQRDAVSGVAYAPDGSLVTADLSGAVRIWEPQRLQERGRVDCRANSLLSIAVSPDGSRLAIGSWNEKAVTLHKLPAQRQPMKR